MKRKNNIPAPSGLKERLDTASRMLKKREEAYTALADWTVWVCEQKEEAQPYLVATLPKLASILHTHWQH